MLTNNSDQRPGHKLGHLLQTNVWAKLGEFVVIFLAAFILIKFATPLAGDNPVMKQAVVWCANILMLFLIWLGLRVRGESLRDFGLSLKFVSWKNCARIFGLSLLVLVLAVLGFIIGSIIMANITGIPEGSSADMSGYDYMKNNLPMFLLTLAGVLVVSSFGEEVIYRGFLINRITELGMDSKRGKIVAVIISSIIFGLVHYEWGAMGIVQTAFMGLALGLSYIYFNKRLIIMILAHAYMDITLMIQMYVGSV